MVILVVEDDALIAMDLEALLTDAGHTVRGPASTARRALELARIAPPELAFVNINLRDGHGSGIEFARELLSRWRAPSIFISGQQQEARRNKDAALGYLNKPYRHKAVLASIEVARHLIQGDRVPQEIVPRELELFRA